jgi:hypothetical protein
MVTEVEDFNGVHFLLSCCFYATFGCNLKEQSADSEETFSWISMKTSVGL